MSRYCNRRIDRGPIRDRREDRLNGDANAYPLKRDRYASERRDNDGYVLRTPPFSSYDDPLNYREDNWGWG